MPEEIIEPIQADIDIKPTGLITIKFSRKVTFDFSRKLRILADQDVTDLKANIAKYIKVELV